MISEIEIATLPRRRENYRSAGVFGAATLVPASGFVSAIGFMPLIRLMTNLSLMRAVGGFEALASVGNGAG